ncbi:hypothetical protein M1D80_21950 [Phyllobacteriaceae bacterium JZ32]
MNKSTIISAIILSISTGNAHAFLVTDLLVNGSVNEVNKSVQQNVENTKEIKETNNKMLEAMTKDKETNMQSSDKSTGKTPSPAQATKGAAKSLTEWNKQAINGAKGIMYGLRAGDQVIALAAPPNSDLARANQLYTGSVDLLESLILIAEAINNDIEFREKDMQAAAQQVGKSPDIKASMDQNTFVQIENTRAINQLISAQNYSLSASNSEMRNNLTRQAEAGRMLAYKDVNPFK